MLSSKMHRRAGGRLGVNSLEHCRISTAQRNEWDVKFVEAAPVTTRRGLGVEHQLFAPMPGALLLVLVEARGLMF
jgi:hypothetical protein